MNANVSAELIEAATTEDESAASAEYGAQFRRDVESFVSREAVDAATVPGRLELPPATATHYYQGFVDPAGGSGGDSMTLAVAHAEPDGRAVLDLLREVRPPFSPDGVCKDFAATLKSYGLVYVEGDRYAGTWPAERFSAHGVTYSPSAKPKSDLYGELLPLLNAGRAELLDDPRLRQQLLGLERRTARGGRDSIDHAPRGHDDVANCVAGALLLAGPGRDCGVTL